MKKNLFISAMIMIVMIGANTVNASDGFNLAASEDTVAFTFSVKELQPVTSDYVVDVKVVRIVTDLGCGDTTGIDITPGITKVFRGAEARILIGKKVKIVAVYWIRDKILYPWQTLGYNRIPNAYTIIVQANKKYIFDFQVQFYPWDDESAPKKANRNHDPVRIF
ncbi:MAG: hypothetical protein WC719_03575 [Patescibacteria group bacterium]|jgi:hypothetical protein